MSRLPALALILTSVVCSAATLSGRITDSTNAGVAMSEVRLWARAGKGFAIAPAPNAQTIMAAADGSFTFSNIPAGDYLVDTRPGGNFGDRWYDTNGNGYVAADADVITLTAPAVKTGVNITVEPSGGVDGTARLAGSLAAGLQVRVEQTADTRVHHNEDSHGAEHQGEFNFRGLPPGTYRAIVHDPTGTSSEAVTPSPFTVASGANAVAGQLDVSAAPADPTEPNNTRAAATMFTATRMTPYNAPANARIAPRGSDVDWYCTMAALGDRYIAHATGTVLVEGGASHESPWVDPVLSAWLPNAQGTVSKFAEDDDSGPNGTDALLDTGELPRAGPLCFGVTTYGDVGYTGANQGSAGPYSLNVQFGNRGPTVTVTQGGQPAPSMITINEGDLLDIDLAYTDPEMDPIVASWNLVGASMASASQGTFNTSMGMSSFLWRAPQTAARDSPYVLTMLVGDGDITRTITITVIVNAVNVPPSVPILVSPADGGHIATQTPPLVCKESYDEDEETTSYDFEVYYGGDGGMLSQSGTLVGIDGGWHPDAGPAPSIAFMTTSIPENSHVKWRARAYDGHPANGYSPWSGFGTFVVDVANDPPAAPDLVKPADSEVVIVLRPTLSVVPGVDPEGDAYSLYFEVASDPAFTMSLGISPPVAVGPGATTMWTFDHDLQWGGQYYARAWAVDVRSAKSAYSNVNAFKVRDNAPPTVPEFITPDKTTCMMGYVASMPGHVEIGPATDMEGDAVSIQLRMFPASADPGTATPTYDQTKPQMGMQTEFDVTGVDVPRDVAQLIQVRSKDMFGASMWNDCILTVGTPPNATGGGGGSDATGGGSGGGGTKTKGGCHCGTSEGLLAFVALALLRRRRARA